MDTEALKKSLLTKFIEVTGDRLQAIQLGVLELEKPTAAQAAEAVARELHTMKGEARMLGLPAVGQLAHACEDLLKVCLEGQVPRGEATDLLLRACDVVSDLLDDLPGAQNGTEGSNQIVAQLAARSGHPVPQLHPQRSAPKPPPPPKAPKPFELAPPPSPPPPPQGGAASQPAIPAPAPSVPPPAPSADAPERHKADRSIRVNVEILDALGLLAGDLLVESARARLRADELEALLERYARLGDQTLRILQDLSLDDADRARVERSERDLHLLRDDTFRFVRQHDDGVNTLHGNLTQLADNVAEARLVPLATVFDAFPRAVREMASATGKQIELHVENANLGVDRSLVADVRDALVHLLRNSADHGIEIPEARLTLGKPSAGRLTIRARGDGDMLAIEVEDDGRGIDTEAVKASAISKRLLTPAQASALSEREAMALIFRPGFSTREEVSELSGRGVGMDVVRTKVESLGGSVLVTSRQGRGTTITLRLPQSLALMRVLLVRLGDDVYGIPAAEVEAVARFKPSDRMELFGSVAVMHRSKPIALVALGPLMALNGGPRFDRPPAVVVRHGDDRAALVVDGLIDEREVAVKPCGGDFLKGASFVAGTAALEDGRIAVLLHIPDVMGEVRRISKPVQEPAQTKRLRVLLVDDSPIARATESALVKALGHQVEEAQDGEDGWARVQAKPFDLILTDVQMPKLDGFSLTKRIKSRPELASLPVIILSSLASPEDKRRGADAGADAYLVKGELGVESLALAIDRLT